MTAYHESTFGEFAEVEGEGDTVIVAVQGHDRRPVALCLPHQVYREKVKALAKDGDVYVIRVRSEDWQRIDP